MSNSRIAFPIDRWFVNLKIGEKLNDPIHFELTSMVTSFCSDFPKRAQWCETFCFFRCVTFLFGTRRLTDEGECERLLLVILFDDFDRTEIADDEFVRVAREFRSVMERYVVALAVAAETLRRLCLRRAEARLTSFSRDRSPFELRIFDTGEITFAGVPRARWANKLTFGFDPDAFVGEAMIELMVYPARSPVEEAGELKRHPLNELDHAECDLVTCWTSNQNSHVPWLVMSSSARLSWLLSPVRPHWVAYSPRDAWWRSSTLHCVSSITKTSHSPLLVDVLSSRHCSHSVEEWFSFPPVAPCWLTRMISVAIKERWLSSFDWATWGVTNYSRRSSDSDCGCDDDDACADERSTLLSSARRVASVENQVLERAIVVWHCYAHSRRWLWCSISSVWFLNVL